MAEEDGDGDTVPSSGLAAAAPSLSEGLRSTVRRRPDNVLAVREVSSDWRLRPLSSALLSSSFSSPNFSPELAPSLLSEGGGGDDGGGG